MFDAGMEGGNEDALSELMTRLGVDEACKSDQGLAFALCAE